MSFNRQPNENIQVVVINNLNVFKDAPIQKILQNKVVNRKFYTKVNQSLDKNEILR